MTSEFLIAILKSVSGTIKTIGRDNSHLEFDFPPEESFEIISSGKTILNDLTGKPTDLYIDEIVVIRKSSGDDSWFNVSIYDFAENDYIEFDIYYIEDELYLKTLKQMITFKMAKQDYIKLKLEHS